MGPIFITPFSRCRNRHGATKPKPKWDSNLEPWSSILSSSDLCSQAHAQNKGLNRDSRLQTIPLW